MSVTAWSSYIVVLSCLNEFDCLL